MHVRLEVPHITQWFSPTCPNRAPLHHLWDASNFLQIQHTFLRASYASMVLAVIVCLSVCPTARPSVCLSVTSQSCTKMAKPRITLTTPYDSPGPLAFRRQNSRRNSNDITPNGGAKQRWGRFTSALLDQYLAISQKWSQIGAYFLRKANRNLYVLYRMALFSVTLSVIPNHPKPPNFRHFAPPFIFP